MKDHTEYYKFKSKCLVAYLRHHIKGDKEGVMMPIWWKEHVEESILNLKKHL